jgi:hypothetical protein
MHATTPSFHLPLRSAARERLQLTVIENATNRRICSFPSGLRITEDTTPVAFEDEAWQRAVQSRRVTAAERADYSIELR